MISPEFAKRYQNNYIFYDEKEKKRIREWLDKELVTNYDIGRIKLDVVPFRYKNISCVLKEYESLGWKFKVQAYTVGSYIVFTPNKIADNKEEVEKTNEPVEQQTKGFWSKIWKA